MSFSIFFPPESLFIVSHVFCERRKTRKLASSIKVNFTVTLLHRWIATTFSNPIFDPASRCWQSKIIFRGEGKTLVCLWVLHLLCRKMRKKACKQNGWRWRKNPIFTIKLYNSKQRKLHPHQLHSPSKWYIFSYPISLFLASDRLINCFILFSFLPFWARSSANPHPPFDCRTSGREKKKKNFLRFEMLM